MLFRSKDFLLASGYPFHVLSLVSARHYHQDLIRYSDVVGSQIAAATVAVVVTKCDILDLDHPVLEHIAEHHRGAKVIMSCSFELMDIVLGLFRGGKNHDASRVRHKHGHSCGCVRIEIPVDTATDDNHHGEVHGAYTYHFELTSGATLTAIQEVFTGRDFLLRVKGAINGHLFNEVHGEWTIIVADDRRFVTFYTLREVDITVDLPGLTALVVRKNEPSLTTPSYSQLRNEDSVSREDTVREIELMLKGIPTEPITVPSTFGIRVITHPESLQGVKELSRRPSVKDEWFPVVLRRCVEYWIKCAAYIMTHHSQVVHTELSKNRRELAVSIVWWHNRYQHFFGSEITHSLGNLGLGLMGAAGILSLTSLMDTKPGETVNWQCMEFTEVLAFGVARGEDLSKMLEAARHCLRLARASTSPHLVEIWEKSVESLEKQIPATEA